MNPHGREIILGIGGGISAYKSADLLRRLSERGYLISVVPTQSSLNFVGVATWEALSGREVSGDLWRNIPSVPHISLAKKASAVIIAPTTANLLAKIAQGLADDLLTNIVLANKAPLILVPAMHPEMWQNPATVANVEILRERGVIVIEPEVGRLTGSDVGQGRYPDTAVIIRELELALESKADLLGKKVLISAGGTREAIDAVRYIANSSSGKQGYAIALEAVRRGANVVLVSANSYLADIEGVTTHRVTSAGEMQEALEAEFDSSDLLIMSAAVADFKPKIQHIEKVAKNEFSDIEIVANPDILATLAARRRESQLIIGFAAQTGEKGKSQAHAKLMAKGIDAIFFNDVSGGAIFGSDQTEGVLISKDGQFQSIPQVSKDTLAAILLDFAANKLGLAND
jgi:phosphopantothenoylcysteine decarboxylase/phosphopantothenate--cysteine ligase